MRAPARGVLDDFSVDEGKEQVLIRVRLCLRIGAGGPSRAILTPARVSSATTRSQGSVTRAAIDVRERGRTPGSVEVFLQAGLACGTELFLQPRPGGVYRDGGVVTMSERIERDVGFEHHHQAPDAVLLGEHFDAGD